MEVRTMSYNYAFFLGLKIESLQALDLEYKILRKVSELKKRHLASWKKGTVDPKGVIHVDSFSDSLVTLILRRRKVHNFPSSTNCTSLEREKCLEYEN